MNDPSLTKYDVAFSFASEQRDYVSETAEQLKLINIKVFYDADQEIDLWGGDLYQKLIDVYSNQAKFCVVFISKAYRDKLWTQHELKAIQARAFQSAREYLLPARFDDAEIPGLLPTIAYLDLSKITPYQLAKIIAKKIGAKSKPSQNEGVRASV